MPVLAGITVFFAWLVVGVADPFATQPAPADGLGLNPSLQNPYMMSHPPLLYLGYVGLAVPFAFAMGALLAGRTDERWIVATRRWIRRSGRATRPAPYSPRRRTLSSKRLSG